MNIRLISLTVLSMIAFAANSIFCRMALVHSENDPLSFTLVRLASGGVVLLFFYIRLNSKEPTAFKVSTLLAPSMLFCYALFFSLSYVGIGAGTGALILFASVQLTMMFWARLQGQRLNFKEGVGVLLAIGGFVYLVLPGVNMPPLKSAVLMAFSGISWGVYSLLGQREKNPILSTARNFVLLLPIVILLCFVFPIQLTEKGFVWAVLSGAVTSGMGYVLWYMVLKDLVTSTAAIVQLSVPSIAAFAGLIFLQEMIHWRLVFASLLIFLGIIIKIRGSALRAADAS